MRRDLKEAVNVERLANELKQLAGILRKYEHDGQATVVEEIQASLGTPQPDFNRLRGVDMWGGSGAVWEVSLCQSGTTLAEMQTDEALFRRTIIQLAVIMDGLKIGTVRSRDIAKIFQGWLDRGI